MAAFVFLIFIVSLSLIFIKNTLSNIIVFGVISGLSTLFYIFNLAPDVAITEAAVGSAISTIFFVLTIIIINNNNSDIKYNKLFVFFVAILCFMLFIIFVYIALKLEKYGNPINTIHQGIAKYYIKNTNLDFGIPNIVTAILGGYRGLDTLFETTVIFAASMGVRAILSKDDLNIKK